MIFTLYSFKGGVGRSMALANLAECFFEKGLRVVMIDWDLEAPGLETFFYSQAPTPSGDDELSRASARLGLIDLLVKYKEKFPDLARRRGPETIPASETKPQPPSPSSQGDSPERTREFETVEEITKRFLASAVDVPEALRRLPDKEVRPSVRSFSELLDDYLPSLEDYLVSIHKSGRSELRLLTAGARSPENFGRYAEAIQDFDWLEFLAVYDGRGFLEWLRKKLLAIADVVLIDSRTGVTEMGGVCTRQMADAVVSFCAPNFQNLNGVATVAGSFDTDAAKKARYQRDLKLLVVPTRIDDFEHDLSEQFSQDFARKLETRELIPESLQGTDRPFWNLQIPYIPKYNYREQRAIGPGLPAPDPPTMRLVKAYRNVALHLALLAPEGSQLHLAYGSEIATSFPSQSHSGVPHLAPNLPAHWIERSSDLARLKTALLDSAHAPGGGRLAVWGAAGAGKTSLVARACQDDEVLRAFPDGILWLTLDRPWNEEQLQAWLRNSFALPQMGQRGLTEALASRRYLFVVDAVWDLDQLNVLFSFGKLDTRVILTRDLAIASRFASPVITVNGLTLDESRQLLQDAPSIAADSNPQLDAILRLPLGASLLRTAYERQLAKEPSDQAWSEAIRSVELHGIQALDQAATEDSGGSLSQRIQESIGRLSLVQQRLLSSMARGGASPPTDAQGATQAADFGRLSDLCLIRLSSTGTPAIDPLVRDWFAVKGVRDESERTAKRRDRDNTIRTGFELLEKDKEGVTVDFTKLCATAEAARNIRSFSLARRLFQMARRHPQAGALPSADQLKLRQQQALCTYKDDDLASDERFPQALELLAQGDLNRTNVSQESLGLAGAIYKGMWRLSGRRGDLEQSLAYYQRGAQIALTGDYGYTRINAAFVLDLLAAVEQDAALGVAKTQRSQAQALREEVASSLPGLANERAFAFLRNEWWFGATLAEACFGLGRFSEAQYWIREALALRPADWELESTARQMIALARAQGLAIGEGTPHWKTLALLVGDSLPAIRAMLAGKVGLALSGGGYRASLFHIGVLARLAELDVLRHVDVLSCVSGGSIIGAYYYLEVRALLERKPDVDITASDYIEIVERIEQDFLAAVQRNLRTRLFASWHANVRSLAEPRYTRTNYMSQLLERHFYAKPFGKKGPIWLNELRVKPAEESEYFNPKLDNWRRAAKVPILLLNATTLNTGHNWQFAVSWMGEPPLGASGDVDRNDLLRRMYYSEAPKAYQRIRLGQAVAASACVPGLFDPVQLPSLYPRRTVCLVDGGVHDNQGISGLLEQECSVAIVSDASGQMNSEQTPSGESFSVPLRANDILMSRVREGEFRELSLLQRSSAISGLMFLHLKKELDLKHIDWIGCDDPTANLQKVTAQTSYGIPKRVQERLAGLRTDLDSFSDTEAYALMLSGYRMADTEFVRSLPALENKDAQRQKWRFLAVQQALEHQLDQDQGFEKLLRLLKVGAGQGLKAWRIGSALTRVLPQLVLLLIPLVVMVGLASEMNLRSSIEGALTSLRQRTPLILMAAIGIYFAVLLVRRQKTVTTILTGLLMSTVGWILARLHLWIVDPAFLASGRLPEDSKTKSRLSFLPGFARVVTLVVVAAVAALLCPSIGGHLKFENDAVTATALVGQQAFTAARVQWTRAESDAEYSFEPLDRMDALRGHAYASLRLGDWQDALNDYNAINSADLTTTDLKGKAWALRELNQLGPARDLYNQILNKDGSDSRTAADLAFLNKLQAPLGGPGTTSVQSPQLGAVVVQVPKSMSATEYGKLVSALEAVPLSVPVPVEVVDPSRTPPNPQVRYFFTQDKRLADKVLAVVKTLGYPAREYLLSPKRYPSATLNTVEIWLSGTGSPAGGTAAQSKSSTKPNLNSKPPILTSKPNGNPQ